MPKQIQTTTEATTLSALTPEWKIVARMGLAQWEWCLPEIQMFDRMVADGNASKVTGRDTSGRLVVFGRRRC